MSFFLLLIETIFHKYCIFRWDIAAIDPLPNYMKLCFITLHNTINDMAFKLLNDHEVNVIQYFKKMVTFILIPNFFFHRYTKVFLSTNPPLNIVVDRFMQSIFYRSKVVLHKLQTNIPRVSRECLGFSIRISSSCSCLCLYHKLIDN